MKPSTPLVIPSLEPVGYLDPFCPPFPISPSSFDHIPPSPITPNDPFVIPVSTELTNASYPNATHFDPSVFSRMGALDPAFIDTRTLFSDVSNTKVGDSAAPQLRHHIR